MAKVICAMCLKIGTKWEKIFLSKEVEVGIMVKSFKLNCKWVLIYLNGIKT